ncbi:prepilin-type N-terminal cleavage/methylation domain-containing protein [bacterium]|nr:prepilin-type N-terminal cleavage/methylation domain-containing protein [bacterium]
MIPRRSRAFTLIELLIVVAIIAILAAIAVPNFLTAQTRSKTSRAQADMRSLVVGLASYHSDTNHLLPPDASSPIFSQETMSRLTTPIAYLSSLPDDVFWRKEQGDLNDPTAGTFGYINMYVIYDMGITELSDLFEHSYFFVCRGPDGDFDANNSTLGGMLNDFQNDTANSVYDPTNGTISGGDMFRTQEGMIGAGTFSNAREH